jgi:hypothetical protein
LNGTNNFVLSIVKLPSESGNIFMQKIYYNNAIP